MNIPPKLNTRACGQKVVLFFNCKLLLPIAWASVIFNYLFLVLTHKRRLDNLNTINTAKYRQSLYNEFKLFEKSE